MKQYKFKKYNSNIRVFEFNPLNNPSQIVYKKNKREPMSAFRHDWFESHGYKIVAKFNLGFFETANINVTHYGLVTRDNGFTDGYPSKNAYEMWLDKNGKLNVGHIINRNDVHGKVPWGITLSYPLILNGVKNFADVTGFDKTSLTQRTAYGQKADGNIVCLMADNLDADKTANVLLELGCIVGIMADGGGSSQGEIGGEIVRQTSRPLGTMLLVFDKGDGKVPFVNIDIKDDNITQLIKPNNIIVALDDGHGMKTEGKRTPLFEDGTFMRENEFNRAVIDYLDKDLQRMGFNTLLVAPTDEDTPLEIRVGLANNTIKNKYNKPADIYISVHANANDGVWDSSKGGLEIYHYPNSVNGAKLAKCIHKNLIQGSNLVDRGIKQANYYVLRETKMPAVLSECGFMDNRKDAEKLKSEDYRKECAIEHSKGICEYFGIQYIPDSNNEKDNNMSNDLPSSWAKEAWNKAIAKKFVDGSNPKGNCTREMLIQILDNIGLLDFELPLG